ncbi:PHB depolymerase family esterase [Mollisia scopiformis]|uniref:Carboxylic ester hydrolase n=1 Tax=Mollisia scopiformis TaxID=149040 RepID=A0A194XGZ9_MOLSC|nr:PHB depolymerase family esterase [Mollisia scopiformis]KUJ19047.1 PHB depolymerase family esterase [Mollisia scopiformis]
MLELQSFTNGAQNVLVSVPDFGSNPTKLQMSIYVPTKLATSPAVILALHPCGGTGTGYYQQTKYASLADTNGFIVIFPSAGHDNNCWDVATTKTLTHDGGGDSNGLANMLKYTIDKYNADPKKVFVTGTSSGAMMTNVMVATYPDMIAAASGYSGVAAGCLAGSPGSSPQTADPTCADGKVVKTSDQWKSVVKAMYPTYNGTYPKFQVWHGTADTFVNYPNLGEEIKEWEGVFGVSWNKNLTNSPQTGYTQMVFGDGDQFLAYSAVGVGHTVPVHESVDLQWFGIT